MSEANESIIVAVETAMQKCKQDSNELLKSILAGIVEIELLDSKDKFYISTYQGGVTVSESSETPAGCSLKLRKQDFLSLIEGNMNPQIAMVSDKIELNGDPKLAMYLWNLFSKELPV